MLVTTIIALVAAGLFGVSTAFQHRSAGLVTDGTRVGERPGGFMVRTLRHPLWIIGAVADIGRGEMIHREVALGRARPAVAPRLENARH